MELSRKGDQWERFEKLIEILGVFQEKKMFFVCFPFFLKNRVCLYIPGYHGIHHIDKTGLKFRD